MLAFLLLVLVHCISAVTVTTTPTSDSLFDWYKGTPWLPTGDDDEPLHGEVRDNPHVELANSWYEVPVCSNHEAIGYAGTNITILQPLDTENTTGTGILTIFTKDTVDSMKLEFVLSDRNGTISNRQTLALDMTSSDDCDAAGKNLSAVRGDRKDHICTNSPTPAPETSRRRLRGSKKKLGGGEGGGGGSGIASNRGASTTQRPARTFSSDSRFGSKGKANYGMTVAQNRIRYPNNHRPTSYGTKGRNAAAPAFVWWYVYGGGIKAYSPAREAELAQVLSNSSTSTEHSLYGYTTTLTSTVTKREYLFEDPVTNNLNDIPEVGVLDNTNFTRHDIMLGTGFAVDEVTWPLTLTIFDGSSADCQDSDEAQVFAMIEFVERWDDQDDRNRLVVTLVIIGTGVGMGILYYGYGIYSKSAEKKTSAVGPEDE
jgi:hypothetical protein